MNRLTLAIVTLIFSSQLWAGRPVAIVSEIEGPAFMSAEGQTVKLKLGHEVPEFAQIFTEIGSRVTLTDHYDHKVHLAGSTHIALMKRLFELKRGYLWLQSYAPQDAIIQSANSVAEFKGGEGIFSFTPDDGKSQLMVIKGQVNFYNQLMKERNVVVDEGHFSYVHKEYEEGVPRRATPIGFGSFKGLTKLFHGVQPLEKIGFFPDEQKERNAPPSVQRSVASVESLIAQQAPVANDRPDHITKRAGVTIRRKPAAIENQGVNLKKYYREKLAQARQIRVDAQLWKRYRNRTQVEVKVFGDNKHTAPKAATDHARRPASVSSTQTGKVSRSQLLGGQVEMKSDGFERSVMKEYKRQMRHNAEVNQLINDLESYDQDYQTDY